MELKLNLDAFELLQLFQTQISAVNQYWTFYAAVVVGISGLVVTEYWHSHGNSIKIIGTVVFAFFAIGNWYVIQQSQGTLFEIANTLNTLYIEKSGNAQGIVNTLKVATPAIVSRFHIGLDVGLILLMWYRELSILSAIFTHNKVDQRR